MVAHGHRVLHFTDAMPPTRERIRAAVLRDLGPGWKAIYDHVTKHPGQRQGVVLDVFTGQSRSTVQHRLRRLVELELLEERRVGLQGVAYLPSCLVRR